MTDEDHDHDDEDGLTPGDLRILLDVTGKVSTQGESLDILAALRRKLRNAIKGGAVAVFVFPAPPPAAAPPAAAPPAAAPPAAAPPAAAPAAAAEKPPAE